jgi:homoserine/homoserine lactone efflux protein
MAWEVWLTFFGAAIAIAVSPGAGAIQSMATGPWCAPRILEHPWA